MNFGKAFTYIFEDEDWFNKLIGPVLISLIPVIGTFVFIGYTLRVTRNVANNEIRPLPILDFGEDLGLGFRYFLIGLVYFLPVLLVAGLIMVPFIAINATNNNSNGIGVLAMLFMFCGGSFFFIYSLFLALFEPIMMANFAIKDKFSAGFEWGNFFKRLGNNFTAWLLVYVGVIIADLIAPLGGMLLIVGAFITYAYSKLIVAHLAGQAYAASETKQ